ncbi:MAG: pilus assembly protein [Rubrivivax sp.]|nr:pilus assembly protein [Rubrivivax sp.]
MTTQPSRTLAGPTGRLPAFLAHLAISLVVAALVAALIFGVWYPGPFRQLAGGTHLFVLIAAVDVTLGPLLTLVVFDRRKRRRELVTDLSVIALLQAAALSYGVWTMAVARPVHLVFEVDLFRVVTAADLDDESLAAAPAALRALPWTGPTVIGVTKPQAADELLESMLAGAAGVQLAMLPKQWVPYEQVRAQAIARSSPLAALGADAARVPEQLIAWGPAPPPAPSALRWLRVMASRAAWVAFIDDQGTPVGFAPFDPP